jgi:hypothetical protein
LVVRHVSSPFPLGALGNSQLERPCWGALGEASDVELDAVLMQAFSDPDILTPEIAASIENALVNPEPVRKKLSLLEHIALLVR